MRGPRVSGGFRKHPHCQKTACLGGGISPFYKIRKEPTARASPLFWGRRPLPPVLKFYQEVGSTMASCVRLILRRDAEITVANGGKKRRGKRADEEGEDRGEEVEAAEEVVGE